MEEAHTRCHGCCHCGAVQFEINSNFVELTTCDCSMCKRRAATMVKVHESQFRLISGENDLVEYRFHTHVARHFFCRICGIYPFHRKRVTPDFFGVNIHCLQNVNLDDIPTRETHGSAME
ncbi:MAG: GFA family protein [Gammaproteobacteria bacterium]|nr:GFA family protein [Gammaproteobacteria bacterium]